VEKSSGQFIFASTVAKYLKSPHHLPPERLKIIFGAPKPIHEVPFAELDCLYHFILSSVTDIEKVKDILMVLILHPFPGILPPMKALIENFLFYGPGEIDMVMRDLHSIISVPSHADRFCELRFFHASLPDFLLDRSRSRDLFLEQRAAYGKLTSLAVKHINKPSKSLLGVFPSQCTPFPCCRDFTILTKTKLFPTGHFDFVVSKLIYPRRSLRSYVG
jgi:hypothetical protein